MNRGQKKVSVIMSVYNDENNLKNAIDSILVQSYKNLEFLIVDDGSSDDSYSVLKSYTDKRMKIFRNHENIGLTKSLNLLIEKATGDFIARQDSDDISFKFRLEKQVNFLHKNDLDACTTRGIRNDNNKLIPKFSYIFPDSLVIRYKNPFIHGTLLIKREILKQIGLYDERYSYSQDYKLFVDILKQNYKIQTLNEPLYLLNMKDNISSKFKNEQRQAFLDIRRKI